MKKYLLAIFCVSTLSACGDNRIVTGEATVQLINSAIEKCSVNEGLKSIRFTDLEHEYENCGYRCTRRTGRLINSGTAVCFNNAFFRLTLTIPSRP